VRDPLVVGLAAVAAILAALMVGLGRPAHAPSGLEKVTGTTESGVVEIRYQDVLAGIVGMEADDAVRLTPAQARQMSDDLDSLTRNLTLLSQVQIRINREFREDQWRFVRERRWTDLTHLEIPVPTPFSEMPDPMKTVGFAVSLLESRAKQAPEDRPLPTYTPAMQEDVSWFHVSQSIILFQARHPELAFTPGQARRMLPLMRQMRTIIEAAYAAEKRLIAGLTPAQKDWIMKQKYRRATREVEGRPIIEGKDQPTLSQVMDVVTKRAKE